MHAVGLHSALAIKRQRKRRDDQKRARERRYSLQSTESGQTSPRNSSEHLERRRFRSVGADSNMDTKVVTSIGLLHIGVVFFVMGIFLLGSGLLPDDLSNWPAPPSKGWFNELVCTGLFVAAFGISLIILNRIIAKREEDDLEEYVQRQLTRSRSGHRLERDVETGILTTRNHRRALDVKRGAAERGIESPEPKSPRSPLPMSVGIQENVLEKILEEDGSVLEEVRMQGFSATSLSPVSPSDTRLLLGNGHTLGISQI